MTTCRDIVYSAYELLGDLPADAEPDDHQGRRGMARLQQVMTGLPGLLQNAQWRDKRPTSSLTAGEGERIYPASGAVVVTLPATITSYGETRAPHDLARVQIFAPAANAGLWVYSATKGAWSRVDALTLDSASPFGPEDDEGLAAMLAVKLSAPTGMPVSDHDRAVAAVSAAAFRARFRRATCEPAGFRDYA